ncbi:hypothetical protein ACHAWF_003169 [Thalassiosira exigua]
MGWRWSGSIYLLRTGCRFSLYATRKVALMQKQLSYQFDAMRRSSMTLALAAMAMGFPGATGTRPVASSFRCRNWNSSIGSGMTSGKQSHCLCQKPKQSNQQLGAFISTKALNTNACRAQSHYRYLARSLCRRSPMSLHSGFTPDGIVDPVHAERLLEIPAGSTIYDTLHTSRKLLEEFSIPEPDESALHLLSHALQMSWEDGYRQLREVLTLPLKTPTPTLGAALAQQNQPIQDLALQKLTSEQIAKFRSLLERRLQFEPLQYIVGQWDFHHLTGLRIRKPMLCPRPETEELVELVLADINRLIQRQSTQSDKESKIRILDVGCGTGAIGIAIARQFPKHVQVVALDISRDAVELSNENADRLLSELDQDECTSKDGVKDYQAILCSAGDFTNSRSSIRGEETMPEPRQTYEMNFDIVVSNPPYIPKKDMQQLSRDVHGFESHDALCGGDDGLNVVRDIVRRLPEWTSDKSMKRNTQRHCWMEVDDSHPSVIARWLAPESQESSHWGVEYCDTHKDFCGRDRFVKLSVNDD